MLTRYDSKSFIERLAIFVIVVTFMVVIWTVYDMLVSRENRLIDSIRGNTRKCEAVYIPTIKFVRLVRTGNRTRMQGSEDGMTWKYLEVGCEAVAGL